MRVILSFVLYVFVQTICFGDELPYGLRDKNIPKDYLVSNWFSVDLNSDGRDDYFASAFEAARPPPELWDVPITDHGCAGRLLHLRGRGVAYAVGARAGGCRSEDH